MPRIEEAPEAMLTIEPDFPRVCRPLEHARQEGADRPVHRLHVEVEGEIPVLLGAFEHRAVMHEAGAVEEHVDRADRPRRARPPPSVSSTSAPRAAPRRPPRARRACARSTSVAITSAPSRANASAVARPMPCPAAVRNARLPSSRPIHVSSSIVSSGHAAPVSTSTVAWRMPCASRKPRLDGGDARPPRPRPARAAHAASP